MKKMKARFFVKLFAFLKVYIVCFQRNFNGACRCFNHCRHLNRRERIWFWGNLFRIAFRLRRYWKRCLAFRGNCLFPTVCKAWLTAMNPFLSAKAFFVRAVDGGTIIGIGSGRFERRCFKRQGGDGIYGGIIVQLFPCCYRA